MWSTVNNSPALRRLEDDKIFKQGLPTLNAHYDTSHHCLFKTIQLRKNSFHTKNSHETFSLNKLSRGSSGNLPKKRAFTILVTVKRSFSRCKLKALTCVQLLSTVDFHVDFRFPFSVKVLPHWSHVKGIWSLKLFWMGNRFEHKSSVF